MPALDKDDLDAAFAACEDVLKDLRTVLQSEGARVDLSFMQKFEFLVSVFPNRTPTPEEMDALWPLIVSVIEGKVNIEDWGAITQAVFMGGMGALHGTMANWTTSYKAGLI